MFTEKDALFAVMVAAGHIVSWVLSNRNHDSNQKKFAELQKQLDDCVQENDKYRKSRAYTRP